MTMNRIDRAIIELTNRQQAQKLSNKLAKLQQKIKQLKVIRNISFIATSLLVIGALIMAVSKFM